MSPATQTPLLTLLGVPAEIRSQIWDYATDRSSVHFHSIETRTRTDGQGAHDARQDCLVSQCPEHLTVRDFACANCSVAQALQWHHACRQIHHETKFYRRRRTVASFATCPTLHHAYMGGQIQMKNLRQVHLNIGPAKFEKEANVTCRQEVLTLLATRATDLRYLFLTVEYYHDALADDVILDEPTLEVLLQFSSLPTVRLAMGVVPPGPVGDLHDVKMIKAMCYRLRLLEDTLNRWRLKCAPSV